MTINQTNLKNDNSCPNITDNSQDVSQEITISRSMSNLFKVSKIKTNTEENSKLYNFYL